MKQSLHAVCWLDVLTLQSPLPWENTEFVEVVMVDGYSINLKHTHLFIGEILHGNHNDAK